MFKGFQKISALLLALVLLAAALPGRAFAAGAGAQALSIDTANRYAGMSKSWSQGYLPTVSHGSAAVVLPLVLNAQSGVAALKDDAVTVTPDYGAPSGSPFVFNNMQTTVKRAAHPVNGTQATAQAWLLSFSFPLESHRTNGRYPLTFHVGYVLADGTAATQDFTVYVTVTDGINPYATPKPAATAKPRPQPKLIVSKYAVTPAVVQAGDEFAIDFDVQNTSDTVGVRNIEVALKADGTDLEPVSQSNALYVKSLAKSAVAHLSFKMKARFNAEPKLKNVTLTIGYEDNNGTAYTATDEIPVNVTQPVRIQFDKPNISSQINAGDTVPIALNVFNLGKNTLNNVLCKVSAPGLLPEGSAFLGNMEPGASKTAEIYVCAGTLDMALDKDGNIVKDASVTDLYGSTSGVINVTYEDEYGNQLSQQVGFSTTIQEPVVPAPTPTPTPAGSRPETGQWWISVAAAGAVLAAIAAALLIHRRRRMKEVSGENEAD